MRTLESLTLQLKEAQDLLRERKFRRASLNMAASYRAVDQILKTHPVNRETTGMVLSSIAGELEITLNYLKELALNDASRPFLFQSSLHHSNLGFLSREFQIKGPTITLCQMNEGPSEVLKKCKEACETVFHFAKETRHCLAIRIRDLSSVSVSLIERT